MDQSDVVKLRGDLQPLERDLRTAGPPGTPFNFNRVTNISLIDRVLEACPCLYSQVQTQITAAGVVHLCETTLGTVIDSTNVEQAFDIQHPSQGPGFLHPPAVPGSDAGKIIEKICERYMVNGGIQRIDAQRPPVQWQLPGFISLNHGMMHRMQSFGDFLIPAAPSNIIVSCKTQAARERLLNSGIRVDTVGFGFFNEAREFWSSGKINVLRRFGFTAVYMPVATLDEIESHLDAEPLPVNVNGTALYRPITEFVDDMRRVNGGVSLEL